MCWSFARARWCVAMLAVVLCAACGPRGPLTVTNIQLGRSLNSDNSVGVHTTQFRPDDTMYVSVATGGPGAGTITVRWNYSGRLVNEESRKVSYQGSAATEFHIQNSSGFPEGNYSVEVLIDGESFATRTFRVAK